MDHRCSVGDRWPLRVPNRGKEEERERRGTPWRRVISFVKILRQWREGGGNRRETDSTQWFHCFVQLSPSLLLLGNGRGPGGENPGTASRV